MSFTHMLDAALILAQQAAQPLNRDAVNDKDPQDAYRYTSAESVLTEGRKILHAHGLLLKVLGVRLMGGPSSGAVSISAKLTHVPTGQSEDLHRDWVIPNGRDAAKGCAAADTTALAYLLRDLLLLPRVEEEVDRPSGEQAKPVEAAPHRNGNGVGRTVTAADRNEAKRAQLLATLDRLVLAKWPGAAELREHVVKANAEGLNRDAARVAGMWAGWAGCLRRSHEPTGVKDPSREGSPAIESAQKAEPESFSCGSGGPEGVEPQEGAGATDPESQPDAVECCAPSTDDGVSEDDIGREAIEGGTAGGAAAPMAGPTWTGPDGAVWPACSFCRGTGPSKKPILRISRTGKPSSYRCEDCQEESIPSRGWRKGPVTDEDRIGEAAGTPAEPGFVVLAGMKGVDEAGIGRVARVAGAQDGPGEGDW